MLKWERFQRGLCTKLGGSPRNGVFSTLWVVSVGPGEGEVTRTWRRSSMETPEGAVTFGQGTETGKKPEE